MSANFPTSIRPVVAQEWSLHAELTISHQGPTSAETTRQPDQNSGTHMQYSWNNQPEPSAMRHSLHPCYGFQRGNILFTTTPPSHKAQPKSTSQQFQTHQSPTEHVEQCSSPSYNNNNSANRASQPYNRRCKSTCSIVLSGEHVGTSQKQQNTNCKESSTGRGRSCSPVSKCYHTLTYHCGDPVCYHAATSDSRPRSCGFPTHSPVPAPVIPESCEVCGGGRSPTATRRAARANTFTTHFCTRVPERAPCTGEKTVEAMTKKSKDAASQTSAGVSVVRQSQVLPEFSARSKWKTDADSLLPDALSSKKKPSKKISHSPARLRGKSPLLQGKQADSRTSSPDVESNTRKARTVHIDVYCTGSEDADASDSTDTDTAEEGESWSSPQTVFESDNLRVVHTQASKNQLPQALQRPQVSRKKNNSSQRSESFKYESSLAREPPVQSGFDSDDGLSSQYPSKESSYTTLQDAESSLQSDIVGTSRDPSWSTISSSMFFSDGYDSATATSWKDTATELDSLAQSSVSLAQSDSFEYADAMDRLRIREKELAWAGARSDDASKQSKTWQSPHTERKHLLQQQKFKEFMNKHVGNAAFPLWKPESAEESDDDGDGDDDDETGDAWSFGGGVNSPKLGTIKREGTVKKAAQEDVNPSPFVPSPIVSAETKAEIIDTPHLIGDSGSLSDSGPTSRHRYIHRNAVGPFGTKSPSPPPVKLESTITLPFTTIFGRRTDQLSKAQKFGTIVGAFRKPGHHVGPSKNPDCSCVHCREHYEGSAYRGRARSLGDMPLERRAGRKNF